MKVEIGFLNRDQLERRRFRAAELLKAGRTQAQVSRLLSVSRATTSRWAHALAQDGTHGLRRRRAPGRPCRLTDEQLERVRELWKMRERWTTERFAIEILDDLGVRYDPDHVGRILHKLGLRQRRQRAKAAGYAN